MSPHGARDTLFAPPDHLSLPHEPAKPPRQNIESHLVENRVFPPPPEFAATGARRLAWTSTSSFTSSPSSSPDAFWAKEAAELLWRAPWSTVLEWQPPFAKWFVGGRLNVAENCLDRHLDSPRRDKPAIIWEGEPGDKRTLTYAELHAEVCQFANVLKAQGVTAGDRVLHLPAAGARGGGGHAGVRADRRGAFGGVRRVQRGVDQGPARATAARG